jgi:cleavage and polyadenylation specificity factor subunit 6/7
LAPSLLLLRPFAFQSLRLILTTHDTTRHDTQWTTDQDLEDVCSQFGKVKQVKFFENKQNGRSKGYALVEYYDAEASRQAKEKLQG